MIDIRNLSKTFKTADGSLDALKNVSLTINDGDIYGVIGMSGAGKSTLVRCINMLERPTEGQILIDGVDMGSLSSKQLRDARRNITMIFQGFNLLMQRNCLKNICFPLELEGMKKEDAKKRALELLEIVGLAELKDEMATSLPYGKQRRLEIARALATEPKLLLLDEPAAGMNPKETEDLAELIFRMRHDYQLSVLLIEHDMPFVNRLCERVMVLEYGKPLFSGLMAEAIQHPDVISAYLGEANYA